MSKKILEKIGFRQYCVTFALLDKHHSYMQVCFYIVCYAQSKDRAKSRVEKWLNRLNVIFVGSWEIDVEEI